MIKVIVILIILSIICVICSLIKESFEEHPLIVISIALLIISFIVKSFKLFIIGEIVMLIIRVIIIQYESIEEKKRKEKLEQECRKNSLAIRKWSERGKTLELDVDEIMLGFINEFKNDYHNYFDCEDMPYGRASAFISNFSQVDQNDEFYFFKPERTSNTYEIRENGILIAKSGIYVIYETINDSKEINIHKSHVKFRSLYKYDKSNSKVWLINGEENGFIYNYIKNIEAEGKYYNIEKLLENVSKSGIPQYIRYNGLSDSILQMDDIEEKINIDVDINAAITSGILAGAEARNSIYNEQKNYMNGSQGHGYAAEYGNITVDRLLGKDVVNEAQNLDTATGRQRVDGADKILNGEFVQTKYHKDFSSLWNETFAKGKVRYTVNGKLMKIEVPRDKYAGYCEKLQRRIDAGQIDGISPGTKASSILQKGYFSYDEACNIARAGTIEGLSVDMVNGIIESEYSATISSVLIFAVSIWKGKTLREAAQASIEVGIQVMGRSAMIYTATMQLTRSKIGVSFLNVNEINNPIMSLSKKLTHDIQTSKLANTKVGEQLGLKSITDKALVSNAVTTAVVFGPDICKFFSGKISGKQLFKNSAVGAGGIAGSMVASAFGPVGMVVGGFVGATVAKKVLDKYVEDDAIEMFFIYKEEYLDIITMSNLEQEEFEEISRLTLQSEDLSKFLETMHSKISPREYVRNYISGCIENIYARRSFIEQENLERGYVELLEINSV